MELANKPDFEQVLRRFEAWWHCEIIDRPPVTMHVRPDHQPRRTVPQKTYRTLRDQWIDFDHQLECFQAGLDGSVHLGESFPLWSPDVGPELCATCYGCELEFSEGTSWSIPIISGARDVLELRADLETFYWQAIRQATDASLARGAGKWITGLPDLHTNGDLLAALLDPQQLALEYADDPPGVQAACQHVKEDFGLFFDDIYHRIAAAGQPSTSWTPCLHAGPSSVLQCDFICIISPQAARQTILPMLQWEIASLQRSIYHLDGPDALRHLDALLETDLNAIQWVFGSGQGAARDWIDVYRRVQAAGKGIQILAADMDDARAVAQHIRPQGAWFWLGGAYDRPTAEAFLNWMARWAAGKE